MLSRSIAAIVSIVVVSACANVTGDVEVRGADTTTVSGSSSAGQHSGGTLTWKSCGKKDQCATLTVPLDYTQPTGRTIGLSLRKRPVAKTGSRIGSMLVNPGGPGAPAATFADDIADQYSALSDRFDIVGWDPRGVGASSPVDCVDNMEPELAVDPSADTPAEHQALIDHAKAFAAACQQRSGDLLKFISTADSARDMDSIRAALGEDKITYFGFSYGSALGATFATLFPQRVRAMVIDGASDPNGDYVDSAMRDADAFEAALTKVLDGCDKAKRCAFTTGGDSKAAFTKLMKGLDATPLVVSGQSPPVNEGVALYGIVATLYDPQTWPVLLQALGAAQKGDGKALLTLFKLYVNLGGDHTDAYSPFEGLIAINCADGGGPSTVEEIDTLTTQLTARDPLIGGLIGSGDYDCLYWPFHNTPVNITGQGAGPIVVIGTTGDTATPIGSTQAMAAALERGVLITVEGEGHTGYERSACARKATNAYLIDLTVPPVGVVCKSP